MVLEVARVFCSLPDIAIEMSTSDSHATIMEDGFDLAIHSGDLPDSTLVARRLGQTMTVLVATPRTFATIPVHRNGGSCSSPFRSE